MRLTFEGKNIDISELEKYNNQVFDFPGNKGGLQYATIYRSRICPDRVYIGRIVDVGYNKENTDISLLDESCYGKDFYLKKSCDVCGYVLYSGIDNLAEFHMIAEECPFRKYGRFTGKKRITMNYNGEEIVPKLWFSSSSGEVEFVYLDVFLERQETYCYQDMDSMIKSISFKLKGGINRINGSRKIRKR